MRERNTIARLVTRRLGHHWTSDFAAHDLMPYQAARAATIAQGPRCRVCGRPSGATRAHGYRRSVAAPGGPRPTTSRRMLVALRSLEMYQDGQRLRYESAG